MKIFFYLFFFLYMKLHSNSFSNNLKEVGNIKYLEFSFKRNITSEETSNPKEFFKKYFYNQLYINLNVGSNKKEIPFYFYLEQFPIVIQSSNVSNSQVKGIYNESQSSTYIPISTQTFTLGDLDYAIKSKDSFFFNNKDSIFKFYLAKNNREDSHITEGGKIGFQFSPNYSEEDDTSFINNLKENNIISSKIFTFKYDSENINEDSGKLYIGAHPYEFNNEQYKEDNYKRYESNFKEELDVEWAYNIDDIYINNKILTTKVIDNAFFYSEIGFIIASKNFFEYLEEFETWNEYFHNNNKCNQIDFEINDFEEFDYSGKFRYPFTGYYCHKDVDIKKLNIGEISFTKRLMDYSFNFTEKDLWVEKNGFKYFMIVKLNSFDKNWFFGKPFFKKYQLVFEHESKYIGLYKEIIQRTDKKSNKTGKTFVYILIICLLLLIIVGLAILLIKCYLALPRKKRANELSDENYDYSEKINS